MDDVRHAEKPEGLLGWVVTHPKTVVVLSLLLILLLAVMLINTQAEHRLQSRIAAIRARGEPTTVEELKATMPAIPPEANMAAALLEHTQKIMAFKFPGDESRLPVLGTASRVPTGRRLPPEQLNAALEYLSLCPDELVRLHQAMSMQQGCGEVVWTTPVFSSLPSYSGYRHAAKTLTLEALVAAETGDGPRATQRILEVRRVGSVLECQPFMISLLVRIAIDALAMDCMERTINLCGLGDESLQSLQADLAGSEMSVNFKKTMLAERVFFIDVVTGMQSGRTNVGSLNQGGYGPPPGAFRYVPVLPKLDAADGVDIFTAMVDAIDKPDAATVQRLAAVFSLAHAQPWYHILSRGMTASFNRSALLWLRTLAMNRAMQATLACERYRLALGGWPESLDDLVPEYLAAVPVDLFDGKPIRYQHIPEGVMIWSIGEDMIDNGGDVGRLAIGPRPRDWGWVLLNPDLRGRPAEPPATTRQAKP